MTDAPIRINCLSTQLDWQNQTDGGERLAIALLKNSAESVVDLLKDRPDLAGWIRGGTDIQPAIIEIAFATLVSRS